MPEHQKPGARMAETIDVADLGRAVIDRRGRDVNQPSDARRGGGSGHDERALQPEFGLRLGRDCEPDAVPYNHLTLPTYFSVLLTALHALFTKLV